MGQILVDFVDTVGNKETTNFSIDMAKVHETVETQIADPGVASTRVNWAKLDLAIEDIWRVREYMAKMEMLRETTVPDQGAARISELVMSIVAHLDKTQLKNFVKFLAVKCTVDMLIRLDSPDPIRGDNNETKAQHALVEEMTKNGLLYLTRNGQELFR